MIIGHRWHGWEQMAQMKVPELQMSIIARPCLPLVTLATTFQVGDNKES